MVHWEGGLPAPREAQRGSHPNFQTVRAHPQHRSPILFFQYILIDSEYIQNSDEQNEQLQRLFNELRAGKHQYVYVLLGVVDHYVIIKVNKEEISLYDSQNYSLRDVMQDGNSQINSESQLEGEELKHFRDRKVNLKEALSIVNELR